MTSYTKTVGIMAVLVIYSTFGPRCRISSINSIVRGNPPTVTVPYKDVVGLQ